MFKDVFVHPASKDSGCAVGAALYPFVNSAQRVYHASEIPPDRIKHVVLLDGIANPVLVADISEAEQTLSHVLSLRDKIEDVDERDKILRKVVDLQIRLGVFKASWAQADRELR